MKHLSVEQIESYVEGQERALDAHVAICAQCQHELLMERRIVQALRHLERVAPSPEFAVRLDQALERAEAARAQAPVVRRPSFAWTGIAALLASLLLMVFAYQTLVAFQEGGALDFVSLYASRPDLLSMYPTESVSALIESFPLVEFLLTLVLLVIAVVLAQQFVIARNAIGRMVQQNQH